MGRGGFGRVVLHDESVRFSVGDGGAVIVARENVSPRDRPEQ